MSDDLKLKGIAVTGITRLQSKNAKPEETETPRTLMIRLRTEDMKMAMLQSAKHLSTSETTSQCPPQARHDLLERTHVARSRESRKMKEGEEKRTGPV